MIMNAIRWGIIGCGDVTEVKSGPAFQKIPGSSLVAVMRRDGVKAKDYAHRHGVPRWYDDAGKLIHDPDVNAIYVATPPASHEQYTLAALQAGKPVYVEKPVSLDAASARRMAAAAKKENGKLTVAHYRRAQPMFITIRQLLQQKIIGEPRCVNLQYYRAALTPEELKTPKMSWRVNPAVSGGGLFHDLSPHQLDLMLYFFGAVKASAGFSLNQAGLYAADDIVAGEILFASGVVFSGQWCFTVSAGQQKDYCEINGSEGSIGFSVFGESVITVTTKTATKQLHFDKLQHVQEPMIRLVTDFFLGHSYNPCPAEEAVTVMELMDSFTTAG
jgi:predicted dehydrogenase